MREPHDQGSIENRLFIYAKFYRIYQEFRSVIFIFEIAVGHWLGYIRSYSVALKFNVMQKQDYSNKSIFLFVLMGILIVVAGVYLYSFGYNYASERF